MREAEGNVALDDAPDPATKDGLRGRRAGASYSLECLIETMRREGFELAIAPPSRPVPQD